MFTKFKIEYNNIEISHGNNIQKKSHISYFIRYNTKKNGDETFCVGILHLSKVGHHALTVWSMDHDQQKTDKSDAAHKSGVHRVVNLPFIVCCTYAYQSIGNWYA